ncbi:MAG: hypothetical protein WCO84_07130 [bacterium]
MCGFGPKNRDWQRWAWAILVVAVVAALRWPWREADGGNSGFWTYGFFLTDEGCYTSAGRHAFVNRTLLTPPAQA